MMKMVLLINEMYSRYIKYLKFPSNISLYEGFWSYEFSENKSLDRIFNIPLTLTTDGITGMTYGNAFTLNYLMDIYEKQKSFPLFFYYKNQSQFN